MYLATLARGVTFWDAGEFLAAIHALGIPHPPGTPLFVLMAHAWATLLSPFVTFTIAVNALSAFTTATGCALFADLLYRWTRDPLAAWAAAICAGATSTLWLNATETEVYACAFCASVLILWTANRAAESRDTRWIVLTAYLVGFGWALHLTSLLTAPAAALLILTSRPRSLRITPALFVAAIGASAVLFLLLRAQHDPSINQGNPSTWSTLWDVVQRHQYDVAAPWPRRAPFWLQLGNVFEYADWQFALGFAPGPGPSWLRTPVTLGFAFFGIAGMLAHRRTHRSSWRVMLCLALTTTLGVVIYLNLRAGPSFGFGILPDTAVREARERDYFFTLGFVCWALWAGYGFVAVARRYGGHWPLLAACASAIPIVGNWSVVRHERFTEQRRAERESVAMLRAVPRNGILFAYGDNDTYPLWYFQQVRHFRRDVTVVTIPLLGSPWYRAELMRRYQLLDTAYVTSWHGRDRLAANIRSHAALLHRDVVLSPAWAQARKQDP